MTEARDGKKSRKARIMPYVALAALALAGFLLYRTLSGYSYDEIRQSVMAVPAANLVGAVGFAAASYLALSFFDYLGLAYAGHRLPYPRVLLASFSALSLGHNIGLAALSSGAIRYRFYSRQGLSAEEVAKVILFCGVTVGLGLIVLGGAALTIRSDLAQQVTGLSRAPIMALGIGLLLTAVAYVVLAARLRQPLTIRSWRFKLPSWRLALGQILVGTLNFAFVAACLHQALLSAAEVSYFDVAAVYVIANTTAIISHVPGGLGVIEAVVATLVPGGGLIGALLVFRFVYYLLPLALGSLLFATAEAVGRFNSAGAAKAA